MSTPPGRLSQRQPQSYFSQERENRQTLYSKLYADYHSILLLLCILAIITIVVLLKLTTRLRTAYAAALQIYSLTPIDGDGDTNIIEPLSLDNVLNGTVDQNSPWYSWAPHKRGDGVLLILDRGEIKAADLNTNRTTTLVRLQDIKDESGEDFELYDMRLSSDMKYLLVQADYLKRGRKSSFGNYYVYSIDDNSTWPLVPPDHTDPQTSYATWSPTGHSIAFVKSNDVYILPSPGAEATPVRLTKTGSTAFFNGIPDWAYEQGILSSDNALWWAPTSSKLMYLSFNEAGVPVHTHPVKNPTEDPTASLPCHKQVGMHYPKPGFQNPLVQLWVWDAATRMSRELDLGLEREEGRSVVQEVAWVGEEQVLVKVINRSADDGRVVIFDLAEGAQNEREVVRRLGKDGEEGDAGWIKPFQDVHRLPSAGSKYSGGSAYLDIVPNKDGWNHIALFERANASEPVWLTEGEWEVIPNGINGVDIKRGLVFFTAALPSSIDRNVYSVSLPTSQRYGRKIEALTDTTTPAHYSAEFSPKTGWYVLNYHGPDVPWQKIVKSNDGFSSAVKQMYDLKNMVKKYMAPTVLFSTIEIDGYEMNVKEICPPNMDKSGKTKYAVLFRVYGGPDSQLVNRKFERGWDEYLACTMRYVVVIVDGRGTGAKGRAMRNMVKGRLGYWETKDQIEAAKIWAKKKYVDPRRIGIWGWSYGGFLSAKVIEANAGVHTLAMSIAPVTDWQLYSSIWTERFMNEPSSNLKGYANASISNVKGWHGVDYLFAHGSADDNVHVGNSMRLQSMLDDEGIKSARFRMFPDSDHSMNRHTKEVYECMTSFLEEKWGKDGKRQRQAFGIPKDFV
ncbi:dipeptidyl aminopeptidase [Armillaria nabsnona]|nr:dipeptidyl aminopeptidase [Armillaria nabsnona]